MPYETAERESRLIRGEEPVARVECLPSVLQHIRETVLEEADRHHPVRFEVSGQLFGKDLDINCRLPFGPRKAEVRGVLFGKRKEAQVRILAFRPLVLNQAVGSTHKLLDEDREALVALIATAQTNHELHGLEPVGWVRAHPTSDFNLSKRDLEVFDYFFNEPWQIGLMLRPTASSPTRARCFLRDVDGSIRPIRNFQEVSPSIVDDATPPAEALPPPGIMPRMPPGPAPRSWRPPRFPARATPIWPAVLLLSTVLSLGYWWVESRQEPFRSPYQDPAARAESDRRKKPEQEAEALWKKWEEELRPKQEAAMPREPLEKEVLGNKPPGLPDTPMKTPEAPIPVHPAAPERSKSVPSRSRRSFATPSIPQNRTPAQHLAPPALVPHERPPAPSKHVNQLSTAPTAAPPAPARLAVERPPATLPGASAPPPRKTAADARPVAPQSAALQTAPTAMPPQGPPSAPPKSSAPHAAVSAGPSFGRLIWTGRLPKNATLVIDGTHASTGSVSGELPGKPVRFSVWPGDLTNEGIVLYTASRQGSGAVESPGPQNGWNKTVYMPSKHHAADIAVEGIPAPNNSWKRLVLRSKSPTSVILVEWTLIP